MKKRFIIMLLVMLVECCTIMAVPAHPKPVKVQQPDGSQLTLQLHGDEWLHYHTTADGYSVVKNDHGYYVYATLEGGRLLPTQQIAHDQGLRNAAEQTYLSGVQKYQVPDMLPAAAESKQLVEQRRQEIVAKRAAKGRRAAQYDYKNFRGLVLLVQFKDRPFLYEDYPAMMDEMLNGEGYDGYYDAQDVKQEYTGSVRDYFSDNSGGRFQPQFDVFGPVTIDFSQYDANKTDNAWKLTKAAVDAVDNVIDFSNYDRDGDGIVDMIYFVFAGNGSNYNGNDSRLFWPHRSVMTYRDGSNWKYVVKDNVVLYDYASSVELYGWTSEPSTVTIDGIGTICHEFSHVLGLPDFYDADYAQSDGESNHPGLWSVMAGGSYENKSRTPVGYSLYERCHVGFADEPTVINEAGQYTLQPLYSSQTGWRINSPTDNEFFLFENRQREAFKWDYYLPGSGMLVHRVDLTNGQVWNRNTVNNNPNRNYYEVLRAGGSHKDGSGKYYDSAADVFPGSNKVTELGNGTEPAALVTWDGLPAQWNLSNIAMKNGIITFTVYDGYVLESLSLPESATVGVNAGLKLQLTIVPNISTFKLVWSSDDTSVATVDQQGNVTGVGLGTCTVTVTGENGVSASCKLTVIEINGCTIAELKSVEAGQEVVLNLANAEVLYGYHSRLYVRDATGAISLNNLGISAQANDRLNGTVNVKLGMTNNVPEAMKTDNTDAAGVSVSAGDAVVPREVSLDNLTADLYSELVLIPSVQLKKISGLCYAVSGDRQVRINNTKFGSGIASLPGDYDGKYYDVTGIFGTALRSGVVVDEMGLTAKLKEVSDPTGIETVKANALFNADAPVYNMAGQRVDANFKGLVIKGGKKVVIK